MGALHQTLIEQSSEHFRAYVDHAWKWLAPGETDLTALSFESLAGDPINNEDFQRVFREFGGERTTNDLRARTFVLPDRERDGALERWGVQLHVRAGLRTIVDVLEARGELVSGEILAGDRANVTPVDGGIVRLIAWPMARPELQATHDANVDTHGAFKVLVPGEVLRLAGVERTLVEVYYLGTPRYAPSRSRTTRLKSG